MLIVSDFWTKIKCFCVLREPFTMLNTMPNLIKGFSLNRYGVKTMFCGFLYVHSNIINLKLDVRPSGKFTINVSREKP